jgi:hypothetical protein
VSGCPSVPGWIAVAAELTALADWIDHELGNEHADRQTIAETAAGAVRAIADGLRGTGGPLGVIRPADQIEAQLDEVAEVARRAAGEFVRGFLFGPAPGGRKP